eukprot:3929499-Prymnesium_polylepis.2
MLYSPALLAVQPRGQRAWCRGLQGGHGCARQDPDHVVGQPSQRWLYGADDDLRGRPRAVRSRAGREWRGSR